MKFAIKSTKFDVPSKLYTDQIGSYLFKLQGDLHYSSKYALLRL